MANASYTQYYVAYRSYRMQRLRSVSSFNNTRNSVVFLFHSALANHATSLAHAVLAARRGRRRRLALMLPVKRRIGPTFAQELWVCAFLHHAPPGVHETAHDKHTRQAAAGVSWDVSLGSPHRAQSRQHRAQSRQHRAQSTEHRVDSTENAAQSTEHREDSTGHRAQCYDLRKGIRVLLVGKKKDGPIHN